MPLLDFQHQQAQLAETGRIRMGDSVPAVSKQGKEIRRPRKLSTFRFTSQSLDAIESVAAIFGGEVKEWQNGGHREWDVTTPVDSIMVCIPQAGTPIDAFYEHWTAGGECLHRCDSRLDRKTGRPCICPADPAERHRLSKLNPPQACALHMRASFIIPDVMDIGTWRLDSGSFNGAREFLGRMRIMETARDSEGVFIPARLWIRHGEDVKDGQTRKYVYPALSLGQSVRELVGASGSLAAQLPPAPPGAAAIAGGQTAAIAAGPAVPESQVTAQDLAEKIIAAATTGTVTRWSEEAKRLDLADDAVFGPADDGEDAAHVEMALRELAKLRWHSLHAKETAGAAGPAA